MPKGSFHVWCIPVLALGLFFLQIHVFWEPGSHYQYGWIIPFMTAYLVWNRLRDAPDPGRAQPLLLPLAMLVGAGLFFIRLLWEGMPVWYFLSWLQGLALVAFCLIWLATWRGWRWAFHFIFPLCFVLTAIPWLGSIEGPVILWLTDVIAQWVTTSLQVVGIPAVLEGPLISIGETVVEVAEACSGIRSLQLLMVLALFLGDYGNFGWFKRVFLIACGVGAAFAQNFLRAFALGWITGIEGQAAYDKWHDPTGMITFTVGMGLLLGVYFLFEKSIRPTTTDFEKQQHPPRFCLALSTLGFAVFVFVEVFAFVWMRVPAAEAIARWEVNRDALQALPLHRELPVDEIVVETLQTYDITSGQFRYNGKRASYTIIGWPEGHSILEVNMHNPSICMGQYGSLRQLGDRSIDYMSHDYSELGYETYHFEHPPSGQKLLVLRTLMVPNSHYDVSYSFLDQGESLTSDYGKWTGKFMWAVNKLKNRVGPQRLPVYTLILLSVEVDTEDFASVSPEPLYEFIEKVMIPHSDQSEATAPVSRVL